MTSISEIYEVYKILHKYDAYYSILSTTRKDVMHYPNIKEIIHTLNANEYITTKMNIDRLYNIIFLFQKIEKHADDVFQYYTFLVSSIPSAIAIDEYHTIKCIVANKDTISQYKNQDEVLLINDYPYKHIGDEKLSLITETGMNYIPKTFPRTNNVHKIEYIQMNLYILDEYLHHVGKIKKRDLIYAWYAKQLLNQIKTELDIYITPSQIQDDEFDDFEFIDIDTNEEIHDFIRLLLKIVEIKCNSNGLLTYKHIPIYKTNLFIKQNISLCNNNELETLFEMFAIPKIRGKKPKTKRHKMKMKMKTKRKKLN